MKRIILIIIVLLFVNQLVKAQNTTSKNTLYLVPFNLANSGLRIDFEHQIGESSRNWISVGPQYYFKDISELGNFMFSDYTNAKLRGVGLELAFKHLLSDKVFEGNAYYSVGFGYQHFEIEDFENASAGTVTFDKLGSHFIIGYQVNTSELLSIDMFTGLGFRYAFEDLEGNIRNDFTGTPSWNFGYSGPAILLGIKIGVAL